MGGDLAFTIKKERRTEDVIHVQKEVWDKMRWSIKRIIFPNVKVIENDKSGGDKTDVDKH